MPGFDPNELAAYIRNQRRARGLSQSGLAEKAGVAPTAVRHLEAARQLPIDAAIKVLRVLDALPLPPEPVF